MPNLGMFSLGYYCHEGDGFVWGSVESNARGEHDGACDSYEISEKMREIKESFPV